MLLEEKEEIQSEEEDTSSVKDEEEIEEENTIPYSRFKKVNDDKNSLKDELAELKKLNKEREDKEALGKGEYEKLALSKDETIKEKEEVLSKLARDLKIVKMRSAISNALLKEGFDQSRIDMLDGEIPKLNWLGYDLEIDKEGNISGIDKATKAIKKDFPSFFNGNREYSGPGISPKSTQATNEGTVLKWAGKLGGLKKKEKE